MDTDQPPAQDQHPDAWVEIPGFARYQFNPHRKEVKSKPYQFKFGSGRHSLKTSPGQTLKPIWSPIQNTSWRLRRDNGQYTSVKLKSLMKLTGFAK